jgi:hypothetical protein
MKKPELDSILKKARLPEISDESLEMFPRRIVTRLKHDEPSVHAPQNVSPLLPRLAWVFGLAACVAIAFAISQKHGEVKTEAVSTNDALADIKVIRETLALFPNRVRAIVQDERGLNLVLSDTDDVPASPPLYVSICDGKKCSSLVTFSGQEIQIAGQKVTVLADARGRIILTGSQFVWSNTERAYAGNHLKIEAKNLGPATM